MLHTNETILLNQLKKGERKAFDQLYERYWLLCCEAAYKRLSNQEQAEDIVQNIFVRLWINRATLDISNIHNYLMVAVRNGVLDYYKQHKHATVFQENFDEMLSDTEMPDNIFDAKELMELTYAFGETLPAKRKKIFLLHISGKYSTTEIAVRLKLSKKTVQNQIRTSLIELKERIALFLF